MVNTNYSIANEMGFENLNEFIITAFGWYAKKWLIKGMMALTLCLTVFAQLNTWVDNFIYSPAPMLWTLLGVILLDWFSAALPAFLKKEFEIKKALRIIPIAIFHVAILSLLYQAEKASANDIDFFYKTLRLGFANFAFLLYLLSATSNAGRHGYIKGKLVDYITEYIDRKKKMLLEK